MFGVTRKHAITTSDRAESAHRARERAVPSRRWLVTSWAIFGGCLLTLVAIATSYVIFSARERALDTAQRELQNLAFVLAARANGIFDAVTSVEKDLVGRIELYSLRDGNDFAQVARRPEIRVLLQERKVGLPYVYDFALISADGKIVSSSETVTPRPGQRDQYALRQLKDDRARVSAIDEPVVDKDAHRSTIDLVRKVTADDGSVVGFLVTTINLDRFEDDFLPIALGAGGSIALFRDDGALLARAPRIEAMIGRPFRATLEKLGGERQNGVVRTIAAMEGKDRLLAVHHLSSHPFHIRAGQDAAPVLAAWHKELAVTSIFGLLSAGLVVAIFAIIGRQMWRRDQWSSRRLLREKQRLDTALNNMTQGLVLFDADERIVVANKRYIGMYGLDEATVKPGLAFRDLIQHRKDAGSFSGEIESYRAALMRDLAQGAATELIVDTTDGRSVQIINQPLADGGWVATHEDITARKHAEEKIRHLAHCDALTDLPNRSRFREYLEQQLQWVARGSRLAVLYLDLDHFKTINDTLGHPVGDELLYEVACRLKACLRGTDIVARLGGDEFAIIQTAIEGPRDVVQLATRILHKLREPFDLGGHHIATDTSIGIALAPDDGTEPDHLLRNADLALYGAKENGRGTYHFFEAEMDARAKARRQLEFDLRQSIMVGAFELRFQPIVAVEEDVVLGCEALVRWNHPARGLISPAEFIPLAEETGLINQLGEWVLSAACAEAVRWPQSVKVAINVSPVQFRNKGFGLSVVKALNESGLTADRLELEITEAVLIQDDEALKTLHELRSLGVRIALDDFGTGYSSLSYLQRFPFDKIKIDRCFIKDLAEDEGSRAIVRAVIGIARSRRMVATAEGVETAQQRAALRKLGCHELQGYLFSKPVDAEALARLLDTAQTRNVA
ncbi:MAG: EAL domain-containing protein [Alphaproteobacteria bacterium]|nr:EAL domain-containing protein [Alphaproteobacteria bacterium]